MERSLLASRDPDRSHEDTAETGTAVVVRVWPDRTPDRSAVRPAPVVAMHSNRRGSAAAVVLWRFLRRSSR